MKKRLLATVFVLLIWAHAQAFNCFDHRSLQEKVRDSELVVLATVIKNASPSIEVKIEKGVKNSKLEKIGSTLAFEYEKPPKRYDRPPAPEFLSGSRYLIFLRREEKKLTLFHPYQGAQQVVQKTDKTAKLVGAEDPPGWGVPPIFEEQVQEYLLAASNLVVLENPTASQASKMEALVQLLTAKSDLANWVALEQFLKPEIVTEYFNTAHRYETVLNLALSKHPLVRLIALWALEGMVLHKYSKDAVLYEKTAAILNELADNDPYSQTLGLREEEIKQVYPIRDLADTMLKALDNFRKGELKE